MEKLFSIRGLSFLGFFAVLAFIGLNTNVFAIQGVTGQSFTLFELFGPVAGGFLGIAGVAAVFLAKAAAFVVGGASASFTLWDVAKLTPMMFAAYYFWKNGAKAFSDRLSLVIPALAMLAFWLNPVGAQAWFYALYWTIPIIVKFMPDNLLLRSYGATFTAHAVGSILFLYTVPTVPALWIALIPVVAFERTVFALGITATYWVFTSVLSAVDRVVDISRDVNLERRYAFALQKE